MIVVRRRFRRRFKGFLGEVRGRCGEFRHGSLSIKVLHAYITGLSIQQSPSHVLVLVQVPVLATVPAHVLALRAIFE